MIEIPTIHVMKGHARRARTGHPWIYSNEIEMDAATKALPPGGIVRVGTEGKPLGLASFNPHSLIAARIMTPSVNASIDWRFVQDRLARALALRDRIYGTPYYRLVHAEADGLPGFVIDRFGDALSIQVNTAGAEVLLAPMLAAIDAVIAPRTVVIRADAPVRTLEGLELRVEVVRGNADRPIEVHEGSLRALASLTAGQKTGWFYDQRDNRAFVASLAAGLDVLDLYCYSGGFSIAAALAGATEVTGVDSSEAALSLATAAARLNGVEGQLRFEKGEAFGVLESAAREKRHWGTVICDPPAFVKAKKDLAVGLRGYRKLARLAASVVAPGGFLVLASCSHHVPASDFASEIAAGIATAGRTGRILRNAGAGADHPVHPLLPESAYLKLQVLQLD
ncbi:MAG: class I SAM-dependent rRNA methyltransferase [Alphaproteobacteria bacterium]|nr:class I SAM-dependent rRNA methyltransferase [Alphaproteobacteria bacterium]